MIQGSIVIINIFYLGLIDLIKHNDHNFPVINPNYNKV